MFAVMYGNSLSGKKAPDQPRTSKTETVRRAPKPIRLHVQYEDFDGRVWHEHESIYPEPKPVDASDAKPRGVGRARSTASKGQTRPESQG